MVETDDDTSALSTVKNQFEGLPAVEDSQSLRWMPLDTLHEDNLTLPVDKVVARMFAEELNSNL
ncbi:MAG: hypothetical protein M0D57_20035 [Sphingobacteriales bacterium JAD_PAG50586_3]|nr:MAG: hypothetical protein M0D57_20035 [Sphingobacteriales bacterium JAD_PAG50586_3]